MKRIKKRKRTTFAKLFVKNVVIALLLTAIFASVLFFAGRNYILRKASNEILPYMESCVQREVLEAENNRLSNNSNGDGLTGRLRSAIHSSFELVDDTDWYISYGFTENCTALIAILDENGDIQYSSREGLVAFQKGEDERLFMDCNSENLAIPGLIQLEKDYYTMCSSAKKGIRTGVQVVMTNAYVNREQHSFIPHEIQLNLVEITTNDVLYEKNEMKTIDSKSYIIDVPALDGYEFMEFYNSEDSKAHHKLSFCYFNGTAQDDFDSLLYDLYDTVVELDLLLTPSSGYNFFNVTPTSECRYSGSKIRIDGAQRNLLVVLKTDVWNSVTKPLYFKAVILFLFAALLIALLDSWRRNVKNQAEYAFGDYQKALTNDLAHDLKTPLMVIGGYAENVLESSLSEEEKNRYLNSILDNVRYTDSIINRTLALNNMDEAAVFKRETVNVQELVKTGAERYALMLGEHNITVNITGQAEVTADAGMLETAIENLISNAVKYTPENGTIQIEISQKACRITNTVREKIDVTDLKKPFVKGDKARSGKLGSGLGLSIADKAASANDFQLKLSCSDTKFTAVLLFDNHYPQLKAGI